MNLIAESALLTAVRKHLIEQLALKDDEIDIELDDLAPAMAGRFYYCISPANGGMGMHSAKGAGIVNNTFGCRVSIIERITNVPRDDRRTVFIDRLKSINKRLSDVAIALRWNYAVMGYANADLAEQGDTGSFIKPLVPASFDAKPKTVTSDIYNAKHTGTGGDPVVGLLRGITFGSAEYYGVA